MALLIQILCLINIYQLDNSWRITKQSKVDEFSNCRLFLAFRGNSLSNLDDNIFVRHNVNSFENRGLATFADLLSKACDILSSFQDVRTLLCWLRILRYYYRLFFLDLSIIFIIILAFFGKHIHFVH